MTSRRDFLTQSVARLAPTAAHNKSAGETALIDMHQEGARELVAFFNETRVDPRTITTAFLITISDIGAKRLMLFSSEGNAGQRWQSMNGGRWHIVSTFADVDWRSGKSHWWKNKDGHLVAWDPHADEGFAEVWTETASSISIEYVEIKHLMPVRDAERPGRISHYVYFDRTIPFANVRFPTVESIPLEIRP